jgi:hypothetical protein
MDSLLMVTIAGLATKMGNSHGQNRINRTGTAVEPERRFAETNWVPERNDVSILETHSYFIERLHLNINIFVMIQS